MPNNFSELSVLLESAPEEHLKALGKIIDSSLGSSPSVICDHLCFLRAGALGQLIDRRDYKQLVTDVADRVKIDWTELVQFAPWSDLSAEQIESAVVRKVEVTPHPSDDTQAHFHASIQYVVKAGLTKQFFRYVPLASGLAPVANEALDKAFSVLSTDWSKLLAAVVFINRVIRPAGAKVN